MTPFIGKIIIGSITGALALFCGYGTWSYLEDYRSAGSSVREMRVEEAITAESVADNHPHWVRISTKLEPTCESLRESSTGHVDNTTHLALDESKKYGLFLEYQGNATCEQAAAGPWEGMLAPASDRYVAFWQNHGGSVPSTVLPLMRLDVGRTRDYFLKQAGMAGFMALVLGTVFVVVLRMKTRGVQPQFAQRASAGGSR